MLHQLAVATAVVIGLMLFWVGVQALVRKRSGRGPDEDVLACTLCSAGGWCICGLRENRDERSKPSPREREEVHP